MKLVGFAKVFNQKEKSGLKIYNFLNSIFYFGQSVLFGCKKDFEYNAKFNKVTRVSLHISIIVSKCEDGVLPA